MSIGTPKALKELEVKVERMKANLPNFQGPWAFQEMRQIEIRMQGYRDCWEAVKPALEKAAILESLSMRAAHRTALSTPEKAELHGYSVEFRDAFEGLGLEDGT